MVDSPAAPAAFPRHLRLYPNRGKLGSRWKQAMPLIAVHVASLGALWSGVTWQSVVCCIALYWIRMFGTTAGYHRYFSHRTFKTSRWFQFVLAFLAESSAQKGVLWWSAHHRHHHRYSDTEHDIHSPRQKGFWYAHIAWIYDGLDETNFDAVRDLTRFPELRWLNRHWLVPPTVLAVATWLLLGWPGLFVGFFLSTVILWHGTFTINSLSHVIGKRRFQTTDDSRNHWLLALITMGEGWHNNHHHYMLSTRQGFRWWEVDMTYYVLKVMSWVGLVWDLREPPAAMLVDGPASETAAEEPIIALPEAAP
jgi:stearoyl-CoA desaturase (delta-9 desaturase)